MTDITIYDFDVIEPHNLANQAYLHHQIGMLKVDALKELYTLKTGAPAPDSLAFINQRVGDEYTPQLSGVVFLLTDTMASRREIWEKCIVGSQTFLMIETRMASSYGDVKVVNPFDAEQSTQWLNSLTSDDDAEVSLCGTSISVGPTASIIANLAVWQMIHGLTNEEAVDKSINIHLKPLMLTV